MAAVCYHYEYVGQLLPPKYAMRFAMANTANWDATRCTRWGVRYWRNAYLHLTGGRIEFGRYSSKSKSSSDAGDNAGDAGNDACGGAVGSSKGCDGISVPVDGVGANSSTADKSSILSGRMHCSAHSSKSWVDLYSEVRTICIAARQEQKSAPLHMVIGSERWVRVPNAQLDEAVLYNQVAWRNWFTKSDSQCDNYLIDVHLYERRNKLTNKIVIEKQEGGDGAFTATHPCIGEWTEDDLSSIASNICEPYSYMREQFDRPFRQIDFTQAFGKPEHFPIIKTFLKRSEGSNDGAQWLCTVAALNSDTSTAGASGASATGSATTATGGGTSTTAATTGNVGTVVKTPDGIATTASPCSSTTTAATAWSPTSSAANSPLNTAGSITTTIAAAAAAPVYTLSGLQQYLCGEEYNFMDRDSYGHYEDYYENGCDSDLEEEVTPDNCLDKDTVYRLCSMGTAADFINDNDDYNSDSGTAAADPTTTATTASSTTNNTADTTSTSTGTNTTTGGSSVVRVSSCPLVAASIAHGVAVALKYNPTYSAVPFVRDPKGQTNDSLYCSSVTSEGRRVMRDSHLYRYICSNTPKDSKYGAHKQTSSKTTTTGGGGTASGGTTSTATAAVTSGRSSDIYINPKHLHEFGRRWRLSIVDRLRRAVLQLPTFYPYADGSLWELSLSNCDMLDNPHMAVNDHEDQCHIALIAPQAVLLIRFHSDRC